MAVTDPLTSVPEEIASGSTFKLKLTFSDFPPSAGWSTTMYLAGRAVASAIGAATSGAYAYTFPAATTAKWPPGTYQWRITATKTGETYAVTSGVIEVLPNLAAAGAGDMQSFAEKMLAAIEARMEGRLDSDLESYGIAGRQAVRIPFERLAAERERYAQKVYQEKHPGEWGPPIRAVFTGVESET